MPVKKIIECKNAPAPIGPYSQAIIFDKFIFTSGQIAIDPLSNQVIQDDIEKQTIQVLDNLRLILKEAGSSFDSVIKTTIYLKDMKDFPEVNKIYEKSFKNSKPARSTVEVSNLPKNVRIEIDCIAHLV